MDKIRLEIKKYVYDLLQSGVKEFTCAIHEFKDVETYFNSLKSTYGKRLEILHTGGESYFVGIVDKNIPSVNKPLNLNSICVSKENWCLEYEIMNTNIYIFNAVNAGKRSVSVNIFTRVDIDKLADLYKNAGYNVTYGQAIDFFVFKLEW